MFSPTSLVRFRVATQTDNVRVGDWNPREGLKVASKFSDPLLFFLSFFLSFMNGSFPFLTTDLTHVTCELQSSSAHHSLWLSGRASHSICRIPFYNRTFFLLIINSKTVNGHICTLSLPPQRVFVFYLHSLVRVHCINLQPLVTKPLAKLRTPVLNRVRTKQM